MNPRPQTTLYLAYAVPNSTDNMTYYPQAVIRNSQTGVKIATVNLTQDPNLAQRYTGSLLLPADSTGNGYYIDIITTPYTDSGHTTPSANYYSDVQQMFVYQAPSNYGGGYMENPLTEKKVRELLRKEIRNIKFPEFPDIPEPLLPDFSETHSRIEKVGSSVSELHRKIDNRPRFKETDLSPVVKIVEEHTSAMKRISQQLVAEHKKELDQVVNESVNQFKREMSSFMGTLMMQLRGNVEQMFNSSTEKIGSMMKDGGVSIPISFRDHSEKPKKIDHASMMKELLATKI